MITKKGSGSITWLPLVIILLSILVKLILSIIGKPDLSTNEIEQLYFAKSLSLLFSGNNPQFIDYAKGNGHFLFIIPSIYLFPFSLLTRNAILLFRIPQLISGFVLTVLLYKIVVNKLGGNSKTLLYFSFILSVSPWVSTVSYLFLPESLSLIFVLTAFLLIKTGTRTKEIKPIIILTLLLASAFSSLAGLFFILTIAFLTPMYFFVKKPSFKLPRTMAIALPFFYVILLSIIFINKTYLVSRLSRETFIEKIRPSILADEINERQKMDFLSMNKNFILPPLVRKIIYNKPSLALTKIVAQTIGIIDFEQWSFPAESYDQIRASGILPKSNLPLLYFFEIPLIILGAYLLTKRSKAPKASLVLIAAIVPYIIFEKRDLVFSGIFFIPLILFSEAMAITWLTTKIALLNKHKALFLAVSVILITVPSIINFYNLFFLRSENYKRSDQPLFRQIASWISENKNSYSKIAVTDRFGPTHLTTSFFLNVPPRDFWPNYLNPQYSDSGQVIKIQNMEFRPINWPTEQPNPDTVYIGFLGEFLKPSEDIESQQLPADINLLNKIDFPDELVYQFGRSILIIKGK